MSTEYQRYIDTGPKKNGGYFAGVVRQQIKQSLPGTRKGCVTKFIL